MRMSLIQLIIAVIQPVGEFRVWLAKRHHAQVMAGNHGNAALISLIHKVPSVIFCPMLDLAIRLLPQQHQ